MDLENVIKRIALQNAINYGGKALLKSVIPKILAERPEIKKEIKSIIPTVEKIIEEINSWSIEKQREELLNLLMSSGFIKKGEKEKLKEFKEVKVSGNTLFLKFPDFSLEIKLSDDKREIIVKPKDRISILKEIFGAEVVIKEKDKEKPKLPELKNAEKGKVVTRFAPNPSGYLHLGHARAIILSYEYARMYDGKFILRLEDTDPKIKRPELEAYEKIPEDVEWLIEDEPDEFYIQSERMEIYYKYAKKLIEMGKAYVDLSPPEILREKRRLGEPTKYRDNSIEENLELWEKMLNWEFNEGEAVLRIKTDLNHPNPSVRDWIAFRIVDTKKLPHPWVGSEYCVWPTYNFAVSIDDHLMGVTHVFRMKEHAVNSEKQKYIFKYFGWEFPTVTNYGALIIKGGPSHKSEIRKMIEEGKLAGWDDPFLHTLRGLRRRGIHPRAIKYYIIELGPNPVDVEVNWEKIYKYNREIYDPIANRYFFIEKPVEIIVENVPEMEIKIRKHPQENKGYRIINVRTAVFIIDKNDWNKINDGEVIRFMEGFNIRILDKESKVAEYIDDSLETAKRYDAKIIHWLPKDEEEIIKLKIWKPEGKIEGVAERNIREVKDGEVVQFERYGFAKREGDYFIYMHP